MPGTGRTWAERLTGRRHRVPRAAGAVRTQILENGFRLIAKLFWIIGQHGGKFMLVGSQVQISKRGHINFVWKKHLTQLLLVIEIQINVHF